MSGIIVVGAQWGDEGKGKVVDVFSAESDYVVRYQGGANAGHTLVVNEKKTVLHLVPSGVLHDTTKCIIAAGVVLDLEQINKEISALKASGTLKSNDQILISDGATVLLPHHRQLDQAREQTLKNEKIGTTGKGIGPAYEDRAARRALLFGDLFLPEEKIRKKLEHSLKETNFLLEKYYDSNPIATDQVMEVISTAREQLKPFRCHDVSLLIHRAMKGGRRVLFEGAQGTLLDLMHGTYPFVTSSSTLAGSACIGAGIGPTAIDKVVGITKAYTTRVGSGLFPTELFDKTGKDLQTKGDEFGATTGRPRRCGWLDLVALKYAIRTNGLTSLALMKLDVLSGFDEIKVCVSYKDNQTGQLVDEYPMNSSMLETMTPIYEAVSGWQEDISSCTKIEELPKNAQDYLNKIETAVKMPIDVVSVGPGRKQTIWVRPLFND